MLLERERVDDRATDLWTPLVALALVADAEDGGTRGGTLLAVAREVGVEGSSSALSGHKVVSSRPSSARGWSGLRDNHKPTTPSGMTGRNGAGPRPARTLPARWSAHDGVSAISFRTWPAPITST